MATLWSKFMNYSPAEPEWFDRDRFVLSNGHACALQYSMLHLSGYDLSLDDLKLFRQCDSKTPGRFLSLVVCGPLSKPSSFLKTYFTLP